MTDNKRNVFWIRAEHLSAAKRLKQMMLFNRMGAWMEQRGLTFSRRRGVSA